MATKVTDPAVLASLNAAAPAAAPQKVTDPAVLAQLNGAAAAPAGAYTGDPSNSPDMQALRALFQKNNAAAAPAAPSPAGNPLDSSLPGPLGQLANTSNAAFSGMSQGATLGWGDELAAGLMTPIDMIRNGSTDIPGTFGKALAATQGANANAEALNPQAAQVGDSLGTAVLMGKSKPGAASFAGAKPTTGSLALRGAAAGAAYGAVNGAGRGTDAQSRGWQALTGAATGAAFGGVAGAAAGQAVKPNAVAVAPSLGDLEAAKVAAYHHADNLGVVYSPSGYDTMVNNLVKAAKGDNINEKLHPGSFTILQQMAKEPPGYAPTLTQLDDLRKQVGRDAFTSESDAHFGKQIIKGIDDFIDNASNAQVASGSGPAAAQAISDARSANAVWRKAQTVQGLISNAELSAGAANSGGNINNSIRQQFKTMLRVDPKTGKSQAQMQGFTPDEIHQMQNLVLGGGKENAMRFLGNLLKPNAITAGPWALGIHAMPALAAVPAGGMLLKHLADTGTINKAAQLRAFVASGGKIPAPNVGPGFIPGVARAAAFGGAQMPNLPNYLLPILQPQQKQPNGR